MTQLSLHDLDQDRVLYLVPYAHLDTQWRWDYKTTITRYLKDTLERNFDLLERYPHYVFNFSGAIRYRMMQEYYPEEFDRLKAYVTAGRWQIAGCQVEEADAIIPSPESLIRQVLYGYRYFQETFGRAPVDYILPDCFGFPWFMPSALAHCGIQGFSTQKLTWNSAVGIPFDVGVWEGPDGAGVVAALNPGMYVGRVLARPDRNRRWIRRLVKNGKRNGVWADYRYYGTGDVGGAPAEGSVRNVEKSLAADEGARPQIAVHQGASDQMFRDLTEAQKERLPRYSGDLLLTRHSAGMLTSQSAIKRWNRKNELLADAAERLAVIAARLGAPYPKETLNKAWLRILGSQMHDILPGTSLPGCYDYAHNDETLAANALAGVLADAVSTLTSCMEATGPGIGLLVYNPLSFARQDVVEAMIPLGEAPAVRVTGPDGEAVPSQIVERIGEQARVLFWASVPSCGIALFCVEPADAPEAFDTGLRVDRTGLENERYRIAVDDEGRITSIVDKAEADQSPYAELLTGPIEYQFLRETPAIFPAWNMEWKDRKKAPYARLSGPAHIQVVESGPVRVAVQVERAFGGSTFRQQIRLACGAAGERAGHGAGDRIEFADEIDWRETGCSLKVAFPLAVSAPEATYNWELGKIRRGNNDPRKFEVPAHQWFDLTTDAPSAADGSYGVTVLEDCKYGSDKPADNMLRLTLLYTPRIGPRAPAFRDQGSQDWGQHHVLYGLYGHRGSWQEGGSERQALRLNQPLRAFRVPNRPGPGDRRSLGKRFSFVQVDSEQVGLRAIKQAEDRETTILRVHELWGRPADRVALAFGGDSKSGRPTRAWETDGVERRIREVELTDGKLPLKMGAFGIVSVEVQFAPGPAQVAAPTCVPLHLPLDVRAFTRDGERERGELPGGRSYPHEQIPAEIVCGGVPLYTGVHLDHHALACRGQALTLPEGDFDVLALLAAADADTAATLYLDDAPVPLFIQAGQGFIGQWDRRTWDRPMDKQPDYIWRARVTGLEPGYIKRDRVAWYTTHMHSPEGNEAYDFGYLFLYTVPLPQGARRLRLPGDPSIRLFAATAARGAFGAQPAAALYEL